MHIIREREYLVEKASMNLGNESATSRIQIAKSRLHNIASTANPRRVEELLRSPSHPTCDTRVHHRLRRALSRKFIGCGVYFHYPKLGEWNWAEFLVSLCTLLCPEKINRSIRYAKRIQLVFHPSIYPFYSSTISVSHTLHHNSGSFVCDGSSW